MTHLPARIDRAALDRILQRATELQAGERDPGHDLTPDELFALGRDVGLPTRYLHQALLEEQSRVGGDPVSGALGFLAGPGSALTQRVVQGEADAVQDALVNYMHESELLVAQREREGSVLFEPIGGIAGAIRKSTAAFGRTSRGFLLDSVRAVRAVVTPLETGFVHVALTADVRNIRAGYVGGGAAGFSLGVAGAAVLLALGAFPLIAVAPLALGTGLGFGIVRQYAPRHERVSLGLERALDFLEQRGSKSRHQVPPRAASLSSALLGEVRKMIK